MEDVLINVFSLTWDSWRTFELMSLFCFCGLCIQVLKERVSRKDELLMGYEQDLAKLR